MVNVLLESYDLTAPFLVEELRSYIKPTDHVAIVAFSFLPSQAANLEQWLGLYGKEGMFYSWLVEPFAEFGVPEENITFVNYFADTKASAAQKVKNADIIYFTGGLPDAMMERLYEFELVDILKNFDGVVLGCSAGAMIQLEEYHITPDWDYPTFGYYQGFPWLKNFCVEVHYENTQIQNECIRRVLSERGKPVYTSAHNNAAIIVADGEMKCLGDVQRFVPSLTLKRFSEEDVLAVIRNLMNDCVKKTYMLPDLTEESAKTLFYRLYNLSLQKDHYIRGIYINNTMIGFINDTEVCEGSIELGWVVHPDYQNQGYATEAVKTAIKELFDLGYREVVAGAFAENPASIRVMEKSGMQRLEKTEEIDYRGKIHHCVFYSIRKEML